MAEDDEDGPRPSRIGRGSPRSGRGDAATRRTPRGDATEPAAPEHPDRGTAPRAGHETPDASDASHQRSARPTSRPRQARRSAGPRQAALGHAGHGTPHAGPSETTGSSASEGPPASQPPATPGRTTPAHPPTRRLGIAAARRALVPSAVPAQRAGHGLAAADSAPAGTVGVDAERVESEPRRRFAVTRRPRFRYTARAAVLSLVICGLAVTLAYPLRQYATQRSQLDRLRRQNQAQQAVVNALAREAAQWNDPDYVRIQARIRLHMVLPGETGYVLTGQ